MTYNEFKGRMTTLYRYSNIICKISGITHIDFFCEGVIGDMFDS